jgi:hypothetical protein
MLLRMTSAVWRSWWSGYGVLRFAAAGFGLADAGFDAGLDRKVQPFSGRGLSWEGGGECGDVRGGGEGEGEGEERSALTAS